MLEVVSERGPRRFVDTRDGTRWRYCGYDAPAKAHLIGKDDDTGGSGELLLQETGTQLHAGHTVVFSPNRKTYLAIEQEDGEDGEHWTVRGADGKPMWSGYAGVVAKVDGIDSALSTFDRPAWSGKGVLHARYTCMGSDKRGVVTLTPSAPGRWRWLGQAGC